MMAYINDKRRTDPNEEYQAIIREIAKWRTKHKGKPLPLTLRMKLDAVAKRQAAHQQGRGR